MADELLKLKWNGHLTSFLHIFQSLRNQSKYTDVTLACEGRLYTVHRLVLASCSQFFDQIFQQTPSENTVIVLNEAKSHDVEALLDYMYCGQVDVQQSKLASFIRTAKCLQIKGLAGPDAEEDYTKDETIHDNSVNKKRKTEYPLPPLNPAKSTSSDKPHEVPPKRATTKAPNLIPSCWVFQRSDLPNTTWSSSPHSKLEEEQREIDFPTFQREFIEETLTNSSRNLVIDESRSRTSSPHSHRISNVGYSSTRTSGSDDGSHSYTAVSETNTMKNNCFYSEYEDDPVDFKKEIKEEGTDNNFSDTEKNPEQTSEFVAYNSATGSDFENSPELADNYEKYYSDPASMTAYEHQTLTTPNLSSQERIRPSLPLKFTRRVNPAVGMSSESVWSNSLTNSHSRRDNNVSLARGSNSQSTVSPKLLPYARCSNCQTSNTKLWRRSIKGEIVCNACGLYFKLHGINRPSHLFRNAPMTRRRNPPKKKRSYEEILDARDQSHIEEQNESLYNESGCDSDTQEGLAVLNAALTLNSLFAKAKAQEVAAKNNSSVLGSGTNLEPPCSSPAQVGCDSSSASNETRPPPPPLLKLSLHSLHSRAQYSQSSLASSSRLENHIRPDSEPDDQLPALQSATDPPPLMSSQSRLDREDSASKSPPSEEF